MFDSRCVTTGHERLRILSSTVSGARVCAQAALLSGEPSHCCHAPGRYPLVRKGTYTCLGPRTRPCEDLTYDKIVGILNVSRRMVERHLPCVEVQFFKAYKRGPRMPSSDNEPPSTPQRTRALFRLFTTSAPPDSRRQLLERVAKRQHTLVRQRRQWRSPQAWGRRRRSGGVGTFRPHRRWRRRIMVTVGWSGLALGASLAWWAARTDPVVPIPSAVLVL